MTKLSDSTVADVAAALAAVDTAATIRALAENERHRKELEAGLERGQAQLADLDEAIDANRRAGPDRNAAAAALLSGEDVLSASKPRDDLDDQRQATALAVSGLRAQAASTREARRHIPRSLALLLAPVGDVAFPEFLEEARAIVARLGRLYANASAIAAATSNGAATSLAEHICEPLVALGAPLATGEPLADRSALTPDAGLIAALLSAETTLQLAGRQVFQSIPFPQHNPEMDGGAFYAGVRVGQRLDA